MMNAATGYNAECKTGRFANHMSDGGDDFFAVASICEIISLTAMMWSRSSTAKDPRKNNLYNSLGILVELIPR